jgi:toxin ParE1/3/4
MNKICRFTVPASRDIEDIIDYIADNIFYRPIEEGVEILRVVSGYRDLEGLFSE